MFYAGDIFWSQSMSKGEVTGLISILCCYPKYKNNLLYTQYNVKDPSGTYSTDSRQTLPVPDQDLSAPTSAYLL